jgi:hypothetical protein
MTGLADGVHGGTRSKLAEKPGKKPRDCSSRAFRGRFRHAFASLSRATGLR